MLIIRIETVVIEVRIKAQKWLLTSICKQPKVRTQDFNSILEDHTTRCKIYTSCILVVEGINLDFSKSGSCVKDTLDVWLNGSRNVVSEPTCLEGTNGSSIDVILTNVHKRLQLVMTFDTEFSDFHHMAVFAMWWKTCFPRQETKRKLCTILTKGLTRTSMKKICLVHHFMLGKYLIILMTVTGTMKRCWRK